MKFVLITFVILMCLVAGLFIYLDSDELEIKNVYTNSSGEIVKIVYEYSEEFGLDYYENHCAGLGGEFAECGNPCHPGAEVCEAVCAMTCTISGQD